MGRTVLICAALLSTSSLSDGGSTADDGGKVDFEKQVLPILEAKCIRCHGEKSRKGGLDMRTRAAMLKGGNTGPAYAPGNSRKSLLVELIHFNEMPPKKVQPRVSGKEFELIKKWIDLEKPIGE